MTKYHCEKHGLVEFTEPDLKMNCFCSVCFDELLSFSNKTDIAQKLVHHSNYSMGYVVLNMKEKDTREYVPVAK